MNQLVNMQAAAMSSREMADKNSVDHKPKSRNSGLTQEALKRCLDYDPETGVFTRKITTSPMAKKGSVAGRIVTNESGKAYITFMALRKTRTAHRWAFLYMTGEMPDQIDHINGNGCDNRWVNLRKSSNEENARNQRLNRTNTSGQSGVYWHKKTKKWYATIRYDGKKISLGYRSDINDAIKIRKEAEITYGYSKDHGSERKLFTKEEVEGYVARLLRDSKREPIKALEVSA